MVKPYQILMVIDDSPGSESYTHQLQWDDFTYTVFTEQQHAQILTACQSQVVDGILLKCSPSHSTSLQLLGQIKQQMGENCPPIVVIGEGDVDLAVQALKKGATDYLVGERMTPDNLRSTMQSAIENAQLRRELQHSQNQFQTAVESMLECFGIFSAVRNGLGQIVDFRIDYLNNAACENNQMPREAQIGKNLCEILPGHRESGLFDQYRQVVETGIPFVKDALIYEDNYGKQPLVRAFDIHASKLNDGFVASWRDVTAQKQTEAALQASQQHYQILAEAMPQMVWIADATGAIHYWNQRWYEYSGLSKAASMGLATADSIHPDDRDRTLNLWEGAVMAGDAFEIEYRVRRHDGVYHWFMSRGIPTRDEQGQILGWIGTIADIDNQKRLAERLQLVMRAVNGLIFDSDLQTHDVYRSEQLFNLIGVHPADAPPTVAWWQNRIHPDDLARLEPQLPALYASAQELYEAEYRVWHEGGHWIDVWERGCLVRDHQGQVTRVVGSTVDVSERQTALRERKQAEAALKERSEHIQLLYETTRDLLSASQPLTLVETIFNKLKTLVELDVYINYVLDEPQSKLHLAFYGGIDPDVAQRLEWLDVGQAICGTAAQQRCQIVQTAAEILSNPKAQAARSLGVTAYASQPLVAQGKLFGTLSFGSRRRTAFTPSEQSLFQAICDQIAIALERSELLTSLQQQTEELLRVNRIKDEFLAVLSHELRSPLNPILGWTKLLQSRKLDPSKTMEALATIERNVRLQTQLIDDLLDIAKILRGKLTLDVAPVDPVFVIEAAMDTVRAAAIAKHIHLHAHLFPIGQVSGDTVRLQQVVWNLLSNAIKFTPEGGRVEVHLSRIDPSLPPAPLPPDSLLPCPLSSYAQITVTDTGKGINPNFLPHIFESFRQEDASTTRKFGGLGLGLAIVRQLVEAHGGTIAAHSPGEGLGATFTVCLPLLVAVPEPQYSPEFSPQETDLMGLRILVVDDEPDSLELMQVILTQYGAETRAAASAVEALAILPSFKPDLLVSDIGMPDTDGYSLIQQVRELSPKQGGQIPAIALTAYAREEDRQRAIASGFQRHTIKPLDPKVFVQQVKQLILCNFT